jgi:molybdopterin-guanine dinucleotide biosynthesis protein A
MTSCTALVLAGGASSRFGTDKTRATIGGRPLLELVTAAAAMVVDEVVVVGTWAPSGCRVLIEPGPRRGPLGALAHGLAQVDTELALVLAGDHPRLQRELLAALVDRAVTGPGRQHDAVVPLRDGRPEPLVACYRTALAGVAEGVLATGRSSMRDLLARVDADEWPEQQWRRFDPDGLSFQDVDVPGDLPGDEPGSN